MLNANLITKYRTGIATLLSVFADLRDLELQISAEGGVAIFLSTDFAGANADLTPSQFGSLVTSRTALEAILSAGGNAHYTNLMKARA